MLTTGYGAAEYYDEDRYTDTLVRLHELSRSDRAASPPIRNAMTRVEREATDAMAHDDRARMRELVAAEFRFDDRRGSSTSAGSTAPG